MKTQCHCNGRTDIRRSLRGLCCACGARLTTEQVLSRIVSRLEDLENDNSKIIDGLVAMDLWTCDLCGEWKKESEIVHAADRVCCDHCFTPDHFVREDDDNESLAEVLPQFFKAIGGGRINKYRDKPYLALLPHEGGGKGKLVEPFLSAYREYSRMAG